ncbi:MAG: DUF2190 family protein [Phycisphaeraceae bacterium]|nr:DUF2190 family protein [Phycisphaeraceae bacterium]
MATFVHDGNVIDYTPGSDVASGAVVVQGELVGVSPRPIAANTPGVLAVAGVFDFPKATGASTAITAGANCYWHTDTEQANTTSSGGKLIGKSVRAAADADAMVRIRLMQ